MKIHTTADRHIADARSLGGGERKFPKTPAGKRQAQAHLRRVQAEHDSRGAYTNPAQTPVFSEAVELYISQEYQRALRGELSESHVEFKRLALRTIAGLTYVNKNLAATRLADVSIGYVKNSLIPQLWAINNHESAKKKFGILKHMMRWAVESEILMTNPALVRLPIRPKSVARAVDRISKQAVSAVIAHAAPRYRLAITFAAYTGLRAGEQLALTWDDIDFDAGLVRVNKAVKKDRSIGGPKTDAGNRTVEIADTLLSDLRAWKLAQPIEQRCKNLVFPTAAGGINDVNNLRVRGLTPACKAAGVEVVRWHDLRHFFASVLLFDAELGDAVVTQLMGHHNISFTLSQYGHWLPEARRAENISAKLSTAFGG